MVPRITTLLCVLPLAVCACEAFDSAPRKSGAKTATAVNTYDPVRYRTTAPVTTAVPTPLSDDARLRQRLRQTTLSKISFAGDNGDFRSATRTIQAITNIPIIMTPGARSVIDDEGVTLDITLTAPLRVDHVLTLMVERSENLRWTVKYGVVQIRSKAESSGSAKLRVYDVRDLLFARTHFIAPKIGGIPTGDDEGARTGHEGEERTQTFEPDALVSNLKEATDPAYWDGEDGASIEATESGYLIVMASPEMHSKLGRALGR